MTPHPRRAGQQHQMGHHLGPAGGKFQGDQATEAVTDHSERTSGSGRLAGYPFRHFLHRAQQRPGGIAAPGKIRSERGLAMMRQIPAEISPHTVIHSRSVDQEDGHSVRME